MSEVKLEDIVSLAKRRGFIFPGSDVYGGLSGTWDYGPLGVQLKRNIMQLWWKMFVDNRDDMLGVEAAILMNQKSGRPAATSKHSPTHWLNAQTVTTVSVPTKLTLASALAVARKAPLASPVSLI